VKIRRNQTEWMVQVWDAGTRGFSDFWPVATWSKSRRAGLAKARECLKLNRRVIPRFTIKLIKHTDIAWLRIPVEKTEDAAVVTELQAYANGGPL
jgi:hypothetical protein